jgi:heat shock protein HslJ
MKASLQKTPWWVACAIILCCSTVAAATDKPAVIASEPEAKLTGEWKLVKLGDKPLPAEDAPTLRVTADDKVSGFAGVNRFFGGLATEKTLFGPLGMTRKAGPPEAMAIENAYTKALGEATRFTIKDDQLTLFVGDKPRLVFERVKAKPE